MALPTTIIEIVGVIAPEFLNDPRLATAILIADAEIAATMCGDKRPLLVAYLAAHLLAIGSRNQKSGTSGDVTSITEGNLSVSYSNVKSNNVNSLGLTGYGMRFREIARGCVLTPMTRIKDLPILTEYLCDC